VLCTVNQHADKLALFGIEYAWRCSGPRPSRRTRRPPSI